MKKLGVCPKCGKMLIDARRQDETGNTFGNCLWCLHCGAVCTENDLDLREAIMRVADSKPYPRSAMAAIGATLKREPNFLRFEIEPNSHSIICTPLVKPDELELSSTKS